MAETRHKSPRTAMRYVKPGDEAVAEVTSLLGPAPAHPLARPLPVAGRSYGKPAHDNSRRKPALPSACLIPATSAQAVCTGLGTSVQRTSDTYTHGRACGDGRRVIRDNGPLPLITALRASVGLNQGLEHCRSSSLPELALLPAT